MDEPQTFPSNNEGSFSNAGSQPIRSSQVGLKLAWVVLLAFLVRVAFLWLFVGSITWSSPAIANGSELGSLARNVALGNGFSSPFAEGVLPSAWIAPLVPSIWAAIFQWTGVFSSTSLLLVFGLQALASALSCGLYYKMASTLAVRSGLSRRMPLFIAAAFVVWPDSLLQLQRPWYFAYQELAVAGLMLLALRFWDRRNLASGLVLGAMAGLCAWVNPVPVTVYAAVLVMTLWRNRRREVLRAVVCSGTLALVVISPWMIRNAVVFDSFVPVRSNFGVELLQGNHAGGDVSQNSASRHPALRPEEYARYEAMGEVDYARACGREALVYMVDHPGITLRRSLQRVYLFWGTDLFDQWLWRPADRWWERGPLNTVIRLTLILLRLAPLAIVLWGIFTGLMRSLPFRPIFVALLLLLPVPYYLTHVLPSYSLLTRNYVLLLALWCLAFHWRPKPNARDASGSRRPQAVELVTASAAD